MIFRESFLSFFLLVHVHVFIDFHDGSLVSTSIAIVGSGENGDYVFLMSFGVSLEKFSSEEIISIRYFMNSEFRRVDNLYIFSFFQLKMNSRDFFFFPGE